MKVCRKAPYSPHPESRIVITKGGEYSAKGNLE
jgi:hypothetical protein